MQADRNLEAVYIDKHYNLVVECKQGSKKACYELYRLYSKAMLNVAFRIVGSIDEAEDVLQEAFLDAFNRVKDFRQETTFGLWLKQIVVHRAINLLRKRKLDAMAQTERGACDAGRRRGASRPRMTRSSAVARGFRSTKHRR